MQMSQMHYLPLAPGFFAILVGFFFIVLVLRSVRYAYESLGVIPILTLSNPWLPSRGVRWT